MIDAPLALAFAAGLVATVNPCGFAMLPAYLSYFMGIDEENQGRPAALRGALVVGAIVSAGFLVVFGLAGILITAGFRVVIPPPPPVVRFLTASKLYIPTSPRLPQAWPRVVESTACAASSMIGKPRPRIGSMSAGLPA